MTDHTLKYQFMIGKKYSYITVQEIKRKAGSSIKAVCVCDCGKLTIKNALHVLNGSQKSCGCKTEKKFYKDYLADVGKRFGTLVVSDVIKEKGKNLRVFFICDCGHHGSKTSPQIKEYGLRCSKCYKAPSPNETHGMSHTPINCIWKQAKARCYNKKDKNYHQYGGRGIYMVDSWRYSFEVFFADMGHRPEGKSLDRIDNNGPYSKENCRWSDQKTQIQNSRARPDKRKMSNCAECGKIFNSVQGRRVACSRDCSDKRKTKAIIKTCFACGESMKVMPCHLKTKKYCSIGCYNKCRSIAQKRAKDD